jgi:hypothetical protein
MFDKFMFWYINANICLNLHGIKFLPKYRHVILHIQTIWYEGWNWIWKFAALVIHMELELKDLKT